MTMIKKMLGAFINGAIDSHERIVKLRADVNLLALDVQKLASSITVLAKAIQSHSATIEELYLVHEQRVAAQRIEFPDINAKKDKVKPN